MRCRVGNGVSLNVVEDLWLPSDENLYVRTNSESLRYQKVSALLDIESGNWDTDLILDIFLGA